MSDLPETMHAVHLIGHGGPEMLQYRDDVAVPAPAAGEVLVRVAAAGVNNTDINTRTGWYSKTVRDATGGDGYDTEVADDGAWGGNPIAFPRIQGADIAGTIVAVGTGVDPARIGTRTLVRSMQTTGHETDPTACVTIGSEHDGGFAQYCATPSAEAFGIESDLTDIELASFPCAYSTAEGIIDRLGITAGDRVLITGASGGVGSAAIQLVRRRGASTIAVASRAKWDELQAFGPDRLIDRNANLMSELGPDAVDAIVDVVGGPNWPTLLDALRRQGRYGTVGAIAGPIVELDLRTLYLKDLTLYGSTFQPRHVFENVVAYIQAGEIVPMVSKTYPLADINTAQADFTAKRFVGKLVLVPPP